MLKHKTGNTFIIIGICFIVFYFVVRLAFIEDINAALASAKISSIEGIAGSAISGYLFTYILWVYACKLGMLLTIIGGAFKAGMESGRIWLFIIGGALYLALCYVPIGYSAPFFGISGTIILMLFISITWQWMKKRPALEKPARIAGDLRIAGYYFLLAASHNLCGIFGIGTFALQPEIMIKNNLQSNAIMLASHVMIELLLGWLFIFLSIYKESRIKAER